MKDKEYCIVYIARTEFLEEIYYYVYAKTKEEALKYFMQSINQKEVKQIREIRLLGDINNAR